MSFFNQNDENLKWQIKEKKTILSTVVFDITSQQSIAHDGTKGEYIVLDAKDWVIIIPEIDDSFLMVKQYRHGSNSLSIEFPGGVIDKGEDAEHAAFRELLEETGSKTNELTKIGTFNPNPALFNNKVHVFLARKLDFVGEQNLDSDEFINTIKISKKEVLEHLCTKDFTHGLMASAMLCYIQKKGTV